MALLLAVLSTTLAAHSYMVSKWTLPHCKACHTDLPINHVLAKQVHMPWYGSMSFFVRYKAANIAYIWAAWAEPDEVRLQKDFHAFHKANKIDSGNISTHWVDTILTHYIHVFTHWQRVMTSNDKSFLFSLNEFTSDYSETREWGGDSLSHQLLPKIFPQGRHWFFLFPISPTFLSATFTSQADEGSLPRPNPGLTIRLTYL